MTGPIRFTVPGNPIPWERARSKRGQFFTAPRSRKHKADIQVCAKAAKAKPLAGPVRLVATFYRDSAQPCDIDNLAKAVQDALNGIAYDDDRQIVMLTATKLIDRQSPRTVVEVYRDGGVAENARAGQRGAIASMFGGGVWAAVEEDERGCACDKCHCSHKEGPA